MVTNYTHIYQATNAARNISKRQHCTVTVFETPTAYVVVEGTGGLVRSFENNPSTIAYTRFVNGKED